MLIYDIALTLIPEIGTVRGRRLIEVFGSAEEALKREPEEIEEMTLIPRLALQNFATHRVFPEAEAELRFAERHGIEVVPITSPRYPARLRECCDAPLVLYVKGSLDFNSDYWLSVVGTRKVTSYGKSMCDALIGGLAPARPETVVVSGLAYGVDIAAHLAAMDNGLKTVAVLAHPLDRIYPERHSDYASRILDEGGALVSEFHSRHEMLPANFLRRNRIIAGLSTGTLVIESARRGGSLSTANYAFHYDRDVMAVPGRVGTPMSEGPNLLIQKNKAAMVLESNDILEALNWDTAGKTSSPGKARQPDLFEELPPAEKKIMEALADARALSIDDLAVKTDLPAYTVSALLFTLELKNAVRMRPGNMAEII